jgi:hypothetical protein
MNLARVASTTGSTAIGGDVNAPVANVLAKDSAQVSIYLQQTISLALPSFLGGVIVLFSHQSLSQYGLGDRLAVLPEIIEKLKHNCLDPSHQILIDYYNHSFSLEKSYLGVEQSNADARYLVRRKAAFAYSSYVQESCSKLSIPPANKFQFVKTNAAQIVEAVIDRLLNDYAASSEIKVEQEIAHLAISLIVADALIECEVLERPVSNAATT